MTSTFPVSVRDDHDLYVMNNIIGLCEQLKEEWGTLDAELKQICLVAFDQFKNNQHAPSDGLTFYNKRFFPFKLGDIHGM